MKTGIQLATLVVLLGVFVGPNIALPMQLISPEEASRPRVSARGPSFGRGPSVDVASPRSDETVRAPIRVRILFVAHGGTQVDLRKARIVYMVDPLVDLTGRLKPYLTSDGLEIDEADVPPGSHQILIWLFDTDGNESKSYVDFTIAK
jgi:hypothetical protein